MPMLERSNPLPLYYQLKEVLRQQIRAGHLAPHTAIPSEPELVSRYRVSRATVRQALTELVHEGLLYRQHGKGTFVCEPRAQQSFSELTSFTEEIQQRGQKVGGILLLSELVRGSDAVRKQLRLTDDEQAVRLERLRTADDVPLMYEVNYLPYPRATGVYQHARDAAKGSLYSLMSSEGLNPYLAEQRVDADLPTEHESELLHISGDEPGLRCTCTIFDQTGSPIEYTESFSVGKRYTFQATLRVSKRD